MLGKWSASWLSHIRNLLRQPTREKYSQRLAAIVPTETDDIHWCFQMQPLCLLEVFQHLGYGNIPLSSLSQLAPLSPLTGCCGTCVWSRSSRGSSLPFGAGRLPSISCTPSPPPAPHRPLWTGTAHSGIPATRAAPQLKRRKSRRQSGEYYRQMIFFSFDS